MKQTGPRHAAREFALRELYAVQLLTAAGIEPLPPISKPLLHEPWIMDIDTTVKTLYGQQEGAEAGYNPHKPGRPSHIYHTYWFANLWLVLDVEVQARIQSASSFSHPQLFEFLDRLAPEERPAFLRGDFEFGNEGTMASAEKRGLNYLFKLRQTDKVKRLIKSFQGQVEWRPAGQGWEGMEALLRFSGWSCDRRVIILRTELNSEIILEESGKKDQLELAFSETPAPYKKYEYAVLITSLSNDIMTVAQHYRDRVDAENSFDKLKNQRSWWGKDDSLSVNPEAQYFACRMLDGVRKCVEQLDALIQEHAKNWRLERMPKVDRNLLRLSVWELLYTDTPSKVILNEALELAKCYGDVDSPRFINGILDPLSRSIRNVSETQEG